MCDQAPKSNHRQDNRFLGVFDPTSPNDLWYDSFGGQFEVIQIFNEWASWDLFSRAMKACVSEEILWRCTGDMNAGRKEECWSRIFRQPRLMASAVFRRSLTKYLEGGDDSARLLKIHLFDRYLELRKQGRTGDAEGEAYARSQLQVLSYSGPCRDLKTRAQHKASQDETRSPLQKKGVPASAQSRRLSQSNLSIKSLLPAVYTVKVFDVSCKAVIDVTVIRLFKDVKVWARLTSSDFGLRQEVLTRYHKALVKHLLAVGHTFRVARSRCGDLKRISNDLLKLCQRFSEANKEFTIEFKQHLEELKTHRGELSTKLVALSKQLAKISGGYSSNQLGALDFRTPRLLKSKEPQLKDLKQKQESKYLQLSAITTDLQREHEAMLQFLAKILQPLRRLEVLDNGKRFGPEMVSESAEILETLAASLQSNLIDMIERFDFFGTDLLYTQRALSPGFFPM